MIQALRLPDSDDSFKLFYPIQHGEFNTRDYDSMKAIIGDLETIWTESIREELGISRRNFKVLIKKFFFFGVFKKFFVYWTFGYYYF